MADTNKKKAPLAPMTDIEQLCHEKGMRMTDQRRVVARVLSSSTDHPDVEEVHRRALVLDPHISIATIYRTVRLFEEAGILDRHDFRKGRARYELVSEGHHYHLINLETGEILEFQNTEIEQLQQQIAKQLGFKLVDHRMELYGQPLKSKKKFDVP